MQVFYCTICGAPVAEGSIFCVAHRSQAALFAERFATPAAATPGSPPARRPQRHEATVAPALNPELEALARVVQPVVGRICAAPSGTNDSPRRTPQLVVYYLRGELLAREFYAIVSGGVSQDDPGFAPTDPEVARALQPGGVVFSTLGKIFLDRQPQLKDGHLMLLAVDLVGYLNSVTLSECAADGRRHELCRYVRYDSKFIVAT